MCPAIPVEHTFEISLYVCQPQRLTRQSDIHVFANTPAIDSNDHFLVAFATFRIDSTI